MRPNTHIKQSAFILCLVIILGGCSGGGSTTESSTRKTDTGTSKVELITHDTTSLIVESSIVEQDIKETSTVITWDLNDNATGQVEYGIDENYGQLSMKIEDFESDTHTIVLSDLQADTTYHYRIISEDIYGKKVVSKNKTFKTRVKSPLSEPTPEMIVELIVEPTPEPIVESTPEPVPEPTPEPIVELIVEPIVESTRESVPEPIVEPTPERIVESTPEPIVEPTPEPVPEENSVCKSGPALQEGQIKDSISGIGLVDVTVTINGCITTTDTNGHYTLNNIAEDENVVINFEKEGYFLGSTKIQTKEFFADGTTSTNYLEHTMDAYNNQWSFESNTRVLGGHLDIPSSVYADKAGNIYNGTVSATLELQDMTTDLGKKLFPGSFEGLNTNGVMQQFVSYGLMHISFKDINCTGLNFIDGTIATLTFDAVSSLETQNMIPLWYYDYDQGLWIEEGFAELNTDGTYSGDISHTGTWGINKPIENEPGTYRGYIYYENGNAVSDARVYAVGSNWISSDLTTDENGMFELKVAPGEAFQLKAYNYKWKYEAAYNGIVPAIASGEIAE